MLNMFLTENNPEIVDETAKQISEEVDKVSNNAINMVSWLKEAGKMSVEGKEYVVQDGDIMHFRFNV